MLLKYPDTHLIILCPQKAVKAFKRELTQKLRVAYNELTSANKNINPNARITIITHSMLKNNLDYISELKESGKRLILIVDEAHCCDYDTLIQTNLGELKIGDIVTNKIKCKVFSYNEKLDLIEAKPIIDYFENECLEDMYEVEYVVKGKIKKVKLTGGHPVFTKNRGYVEVENLTTEDIILSVSNHCDNCNKEVINEKDKVVERGYCMYSEGRIVSIKKIKSPKKVYNIGVEGNNNYFANDLLVHNCLQDNKSKFYQYVAGMRHLFSVVWLLTATPLKNRIEGLYNMFYIMNPKIFGTYYSFKDSYLVIHRRQIPRVVGKGREKRRIMQNVEEVVGYKNLDKLREILNKYVILKQKHYNLKFYYHKTDLLEREVKPYLEASEGLCRESSEDNFAVRVHDLQMVVDNIEPNSRIEDKLSSKELLFLKVIKYKMENNSPTIVYCDYNDVLDRLNKLLTGFSKQLGVKQIHIISGSINQKEREKVEELIGPGSVILITSAGTESINLQKADSLVFYDIPFSILTFIQAVGRVTRIDSKFSEQHIHILECKYL